MTEAGSTTLGKYLEWWLENIVKNEVAHRTYHNYRSQVRNHILPALGKKKLNTLKLDDLENLYRSISNSELSSATVRYVHSVLRKALNHAMVRELVSRNVAEGASLPRLDRKESKTLSPEELNRFLKVASGDPLKALYVIAVTCGLRQGELLGLRWEDVDLEAGTLKIRRQLQRSRDGSGLILVPTKNKENCVIRLGDNIVKSLKAHQERQVEQIASAKGHWRDPEVVFASTIGSPLDPSNLVDEVSSPSSSGRDCPTFAFTTCVMPAQPCCSVRRSSRQGRSGDPRALQRLRHHGCLLPRPTRHAGASSSRDGRSALGQPVTVNLTVKGLDIVIEAPLSSRVLPANRDKNNEPTSGLEPLTCSLRVIIHALLEVARVCKSSISKRLSLLRFAPCCTVLRSRWYQNGINIALVRPIRYCRT
jgi:integrase